MRDRTALRRPPATACHWAVGRTEDRQKERNKVAGHGWPLAMAADFLCWWATRLEWGSLNYNFKFHHSMRSHASIISVRS